MGKGLKIILIIVVIVGVLALGLYAYITGTYNRLVSLREETKAAWAQVENQLQRRMDLIPNYVNTVKGYAKHEREVFIKVTEARAKVAGAGSVSEKIAANNELAGALSRLLLIVERYPDLKANQNFIRLQDELAGTENRIAVERRRYNEAVLRYDKRIKQFPTIIFARLFGFTEVPYFEAPEEAKKPPTVTFE